MSLNKLISLTYFLSVITLLGCGNKQAGFQGPPAVNVSVASVGMTNAAYYEEYPAMVKALNEVELRPQVNGYVTGIHFKEGTQVKKGQMLYSLDQQQSQGAYQQALANLSVQEANLEKAKRDVERYRTLDSKDAIAKQQVDYAEAAYITAQKQVVAAQASVQSSQTNVRYSSIVAPFNGTIGMSLVKLGASVTPGQTLLNTISSDDPIVADIVVDQNDIYHFTQLLNKKIPDSTFRLTFRDQVYRHFGKISFIDRAVDPQTGTIKMRIQFPNPERALRAGMSGTLQVLTISDQALVIPYKAVNEQLGEFFVYMVDSAKATQRKIVLGEQVGKNVIIKSGLQEGETIITEGIQSLREGAAINVVGPEKNKN